MDGQGARELSRRIEAQEHWRAASSVRDGSQPASDPDAELLEDFRDGVRLYQATPVWVRVLGDRAPVRVSRRLVKTLVDGRWNESTVSYFLGDGTLDDSPQGRSQS